MEEIFDVVDGEDRVIGRASRSEVHRLGLRHRAVHLLVYNRQGALFLQKRSLLKDTAPGKWSTSCAGHVDAGESYDAAVVREAKEELGLILDHPPERLTTLHATPETGNEFVWIYRTTAEGPFYCPEEEISEGRWWSRCELESALSSEPELFAGSFRYLWALLQA